MKKYDIEFQFDPQSILDYCLKYGIVNYDDAIEKMTFKKVKELVLKKHTAAITQEKDGRWRTYIKDPAAATGRRAVKKTSEQDLYAFLFQHYKLGDDAAKKKKMTLADLYPEWLEYKKLHTTASTYIARIKSDWNTYYEGTKITKIPLRKLDKLMLDEWAHALIKDHEMTKNNYYNVSIIMRQGLAYALDAGIISTNPFTEVKIDGSRMFRRVQKKPDAMQVFSREESRLLTQMAWDDFRNRVKYYELAPLCMLFQMQTGLRIGEAVVVKFSDIETPDYIHIQRMMRRDEHKIVEHTKTECGDRYILLTSTAKEIVETARKHQERMGVSSEFIFSLTDQPISCYSIQELYRKYSRRLGICTEVQPRGKPSHTARRTYISALIDEGVNLNTVRQAAGHASEKTTLKNYTFDRATDLENRKKFEAALRF